MSWSITAKTRVRYDGEPYTNQWHAINDDGYEIYMQAHTKYHYQRGYRCHVKLGDTSLQCTVEMPCGLMSGLRSGAVTLEESEPYIKSLLDDMLKDALRQDMAAINEDVAREWIRLQASMMLRFGANAHDRCSVECWTEEDGTIVARESHRHEEGSESTRYEAAPQPDGTWRLSMDRYSYDCDGPLERHHVLVVAEGKIHETSRWQRDHYAERMGY